jgi:hypothetical protein
MTKTMYRILASGFLLAVTMGNSECEDFEDVTVPASDSSPPVTLDGVWWESEWIELEGPSSAISYHLAPGEEVLAISSAVDSGGLKKLTMSSEVAWTCCTILSPVVCSATQSISAPIVRTQAGVVGSTVSNGLFTGQGVDAITLPSCQAGYVLKSYRFSWRTIGEDFHGNTRTSQKHSILYP